MRDDQDAVDAIAYCVLCVHFETSCDGFGATGAHIKIPSNDFSKNKLRCRSFHWNSCSLLLFRSASHSILFGDVRTFVPSQNLVSVTFYAGSVYRLVWRGLAVDLIEIRKDRDLLQFLKLTKEKQKIEKEILHISAFCIRLNDAFVHFPLSLSLLLWLWTLWLLPNIRVSGHLVI